MTQKQFTQKNEDDWEILDRNKHFAYAHSGYQAKKIIQELNELVETNRELHKENKELKELVCEADNELEIRDIVCGAGKFRLEEWGKHRYHQFYKGDEELEDETVVIMLMELEKENKELKKRDDLVSSYLRDEGSITLEKYNEIVDYLYKEWKKKRDLE